MLPTASRLEFRRWRRSDSDLAAQLWSDPLVMRFLGGAYDAAKLAARLELEIANGTAYGVQYWPLFLKDGGEFAGCCGLKPFEPGERVLRDRVSPPSEFLGAPAMRARRRPPSSPSPSTHSDMRRSSPDITRRTNHRRDR
jgi:hypothetical protein